MVDVGVSFYRPVKFNKPPNREHRILEIRQYLASQRASGEAAIGLGLFGFFTSRSASICTQTSLETTAYLEALGCEPYVVTPTKEESDILWVEDLFDLKVENNEQNNNSEIPKAFESAYEAGRRGHGVGSQCDRRRYSQSDRSGSSTGS